MELVEVKVLILGEECEELFESSKVEGRPYLIKMSKEDEEGDPFDIEISQVSEEEVKSFIIEPVDENEVPFFSLFL